MNSEDISTLLWNKVLEHDQKKSLLKQQTLNPVIKEIKNDINNSLSTFMDAANKGNTDANIHFKEGTEECNLLMQAVEELRYYKGLKLTFNNSPLKPFLGYRSKCWISIDWNKAPVLYYDY